MATKPTTSAIDSVAWLQQQLRAAARRHRILETVSFAATAGSLAVVSFGFYFLADFLVRFPGFVRILLTLGLLGSGGYWAAKVARRWIVPYRTLDATARAVHRADEAAGRKSHSLTISALEFGERPAIPGSTELKNAVIQSARAQTNDPALARLCSPLHLRLMRHTLTAALAVSVVLTLTGSYTKLFARRMLGLSGQYPSATRIVRVDWQRLASAREDYPVSVTVTGRIPGTAMMTITPEKSRSFTLPMTIQSNGTFSATLQGPEQSFSFTCTLGDASTDPMPVTIRMPPSARSLAVSIKPPAYTQLPAREETAPVINAPQESLLTFTVIPDTAVETCALTGEGRTLRCTRTPEGTWTAKAILTNSWNFSVSLTTSEKLTHLDPTTRQILITPDVSPTIELRNPKPNSVVAPNSLLIFDILARDDYGLKEVGINYSVYEQRNNNDVKVKQGTFSPPLKQPAGREATLHLIKPVAELGLNAGQRVVFTGYALDNRPAPKTQTGESDQAPVTIVTPDELRRILEAGLQQSSDLLRKVSEDERRQSDLLRQRLSTKEKP
jgi:hypothetical protein